MYSQSDLEDIRACREALDKLEARIRSYLAKPQLRLVSNGYNADEDRWPASQRKDRYPR